MGGVSTGALGGAEHMHTQIDPSFFWLRGATTITAIDEKRRRVTLKTQCLNGEKVVIDGEATVLVPRRDAA